jgi:hypothetical protein
MAAKSKYSSCAPLQAPVPLESLRRVTNLRQPHYQRVWEVRGWVNEGDILGLRYAAETHKRVSQRIMSRPARSMDFAEITFRLERDSHFHSFGAAATKTPATNVYPTTPRLPAVTYVAAFITPPLSLLASFISSAAAQTYVSALICDPCAALTYSDSSGVDCAEIGVLKEGDKEILHGLLQGKERRGLEA